MKKILLASCAVVLVGGAVIARTQMQNEASLPFVRQLFNKGLEGIEGWEASVVEAKQQGGGATQWHYHNGHEIVLVLEGALVSEIEGEPPVTLEAGEIAHIPLRIAHRGRNASATEPCRIVVFQLNEKGKPQRVEIEK